MQLVAKHQKYSKLPFGKKIFSYLLGKTIPYTGSICPFVEELQPGSARVILKDRKRVRNHLHSVHAVALMNLAELTSGLATVGSLPHGLRGILVGFRIEYLKKARGTLTAEAQSPVSTKMEKVELLTEVNIKNASGEVVCRAWATWLVGP